MIEVARQESSQTINAGLTTLRWEIWSRIRQDILRNKRAGYGLNCLCAVETIGRTRGADGFATAIRRKVRPESVPRRGEVAGEVAGRPESQPESRPESMELRVLSALENGPLAKAEIAAQLGHKEVSGRLNQVIRLLLADQTVEYTIPDKPASRLQRYRLTDKGKVHLATSRRGGPDR